MNARHLITGLLAAALLAGCTDADPLAPEIPLRSASAQDPDDRYTDPVKPLPPPEDPVMPLPPVMEDGSNARAQQLDPVYPMPPIDDDIPPVKPLPPPEDDQPR
jgi:hypothetical protein